MHRTKQRLIPSLAVGLAALAIGATPALAGSDGCSGDCQDENSPATVVPVSPMAPVAPLPTTAGGGDLAPERASQPRHVRSHRVVHRNVTVAQRTVPRGAVAAGAGGTASEPPYGVLALIAGGSLVLLSAGGRLVSVARRGRS